MAKYFAVLETLVVTVKSSAELYGHLSAIEMLERGKAAATLFFAANAHLKVLSLKGLSGDAGSVWCRRTDGELCARGLDAIPWRLSERWQTPHNFPAIC